MMLFHLRYMTKSEIIFTKKRNYMVDGLRSDMKSIIKNCLIVIFIFSSILMYNFKVVADGNEDNTNLTYSAVTPDLYSQSILIHAAK